MSHREVLSRFKEVALASPVDMIIQQIRELITSGQLTPGDRLPPERKLAETLGVSRSHVREALRKLEFYGILKTLPQSGTIVSGMGISALEGLITDVLKLENSDFASLVETRLILETEAASLAALRRNDDDIQAIKQALDNHERKVKAGEIAIEEDLMFHLKIAESSKNNVLKSLMLIITPDIINSFNSLGVCEDGRSHQALEEHRVIMHAILNQEPDIARKAVKKHLERVVDFSIQRL